MERVLTAEQQKDRERLDRFLLRQNLTSLMNDTKWRETMRLISEVIGNRVRFRVSYFSEPRKGSWSSGWPYHAPQLYKATEWMEINPVIVRRPDSAFPLEEIDLTEPFTRALQSKSIPFHVQDDGVIRIQGYLRNGLPAP